MIPDTNRLGTGAPAAEGAADHSFVLIVLMLLVVFAPIVGLHTYFAYWSAPAAIETVEEHRAPERPKPASG